ncbi:VPLPA-CTERM-specific exosortase XrtD [Rhodovulum sp. DZ06]|uniref:VPLPA-CTERM-specific exosortase XrtD n=1 Tax=Rhodovulum sp. DZ06 TaxID=3425126 RepID=UPI003D34D01A
MSKAISGTLGFAANPLGLFWLVLALVGAGLVFLPGLEVLLWAWQRAEYSHGPLIPLLSGFLLLRQLKEIPEAPGAKTDRWPGVAAMVFALLIGLLGLLAHIGDIAAYALILWIGSLFLISFGWKVGKTLWPPVLHLVFMLPLPGTIYYKTATSLQAVSSEIGVWALQMLGTPVFLDGNIIDLGVYKLHVAEACSGLRYLFPIMSFSYIFAVLYRGPTWHKAVLLLSAVPIAVLMNSFRIALVGLMVNHYGIEHAEGLSHFLEGWVVFLTCIIILFGLAALMLRMQPAPRMSLSEALDLDLHAVWPEFIRIRHVRPSPALISGAVLTLGLAAAWWLAPAREVSQVDRAPLTEFPRTVDAWRTTGPPRMLDPKVEQVLGADDYISLTYAQAGERNTIEFFSAWYLDQSKGGIHSPEVCLPTGGWEMSSINTVDIGPQLGVAEEFNVNRAVIRKGLSQMLVYYWFEQTGRHIASDYWAKAMLIYSGVVEGRTDGALVRLTTPIASNETEAQADARVMSFLKPALGPMDRHLNGEIR